MLLKFLIFLFGMISLSSDASLLDEMSLEEKVGQILMVHFNGECVNEDAKILIQQAYVGNIIYYNWANGLQSPLQVRKLSLGLQHLALQNPSGIPLLIAVDQEGGSVARLTQGFTVFPGNKALGLTQDPKLAERCAFAIGEELLAVGINLNLAPVVDVSSNPHNPIMKNRAFSHSPKVVVEFAKSTLKGFHSAGIMTALKHFPGHGDVEIDSHQDLPQINKKKKELDQTELFPFAKLSTEADIIMTAHLLVHALDPMNCTTLSKGSIDLLRNELGFNGVVITDSLVMEGLLKNCNSIDDAAIKALNAGCDILMLGGKQLNGMHKDLEITTNDTLRIHKGLMQAVLERRIKEQRLNEAVQRVLDLKTRYLSKRSKLIDQPLEQVVGTEEHHLLATEIANCSTKPCNQLQQ